MLGSWFAPRLSRRLGPHVTLAAGLLTQAAGLLWLSRITADGSYPADLLGPILVIGLGLGTAFVQLTGAAVTGVRPADSGLASGLVNTTRQIGGAVGLAVLGTLAASRTAAAAHHHSPAAALTEGYRRAFLVSAAVLAVGAALTPFLSRRLAAQPHTEQAPAPTPTR